jgi:hypothetical protein
VSRNVPGLGLFGGLEIVLSRQCRDKLVIELEFLVLGRSVRDGLRDAPLALRLFLHCDCNRGEEAEVESQVRRCGARRQGVMAAAARCWGEVRWVRCVG